jgi:hypothetical protein
MLLWKEYKCNVIADYQGNVKINAGNAVLISSI